MTFYCIYSKLLTCSIPFFSVSADEFKQVYVFWVPTYQFININNINRITQRTEIAEITYSCTH